MFSFKNTFFAAQGLCSTQELCSNDILMEDVTFLKLNVLLEINGLLICSQYDDILRSREFI